MNRFALILVSALMLVLSACGGGSPNPNPNPNPTPNPQPNSELAGKYNGDISEDVSDFFSRLTFTIDNAGNLTGTTTAKDVGNAPQGEKGTITGKVTLGSAGIVEANITLETPSAGKFTIEKMLGSFGLGKLTLGSGTVKDVNGVFLGTSGPLIASKE